MSLSQVDWFRRKRIKNLGLHNEKEGFER